MTSHKFGRYEVVAELGKGAMGTVYRAVDPLLNRSVAVKTINMSADRDEMAEYEARFYQEARAAGSTIPISSPFTTSAGAATLRILRWNCWRERNYAR
jgi:serine/threonine protein kinase